MSELIKRENTSVTTTNTQQTTPMQLVQMAVESGADIEKLERLMALQERWEASNAKKAFLDAMSKFQSECPDITKTKKAHNSFYAPLGDIMNQIRGLLFECGLSVRFEQSHNNGVQITCVISHRDGHKEENTMIAPADTSGSKSAIQAIASTVTYLQRYTLIGALGITTADADMDGRLPVDTKAVIDAESRIISIINKQGKTDKDFFVWVSRSFKREILSFDDMSEDEKQFILRKLEGRK